MQRVVLIGCGTSLNRGPGRPLLGGAFAGLPAEVESASEFRYREPLLDRRTLVVSLTQSGETADTVAAMQESRRRGARLITICNVEESQAARLAEGTLYMGAGIEIGVASTKTFIASLTILQLLSIYLGQVRGRLAAQETERLVNNLAQCPRLIGEMLADVSVYPQLARKFSAYDGFLYLDGA